jgi:hypothetical protein
MLDPARARETKSIVSLYSLSHAPSDYPCSLFVFPLFQTEAALHFTSIRSGLAPTHSGFALLPTSLAPPLFSLGLRLRQLATLKHLNKLTLATFPAPLWAWEGRWGCTELCSSYATKGA